MHKARHTAGQRVLDVAAGSGNVAIRAAQAGAEVVASDITPENLEAGRKEADTLGVVSKLGAMIRDPRRAGSAVLEDTLH